MEIAKKELKKILAKQREEYQRDSKKYLEVLLEDFGSKTKVIVEGQQDLRKRTANIEKEILQIKEDVELIKIDISFIKQELKHKVDQDEFEALEKRVMFLESKIKRA